MNLEKKKSKKRPLETAWYDLLVNHISHSVKMSVIDAKEKIMKFPEVKILKNAHNSTHKDYKSKNIARAFDDKYAEYKSGEELSIGQYLEKP